MRLKSGNLLWPDLSPRPEDYPALPGDVFCDVLVVGAGVSGALTAWHLARAGFDVLVVDRRLPVSGSTPASTALLQYELDTPLVELQQLIGAEKADRAYRRCGLALNDISKVVSSLDHDVGLQPRPSIYVAKSWHDIELLKREALARQQIGLPSHFLNGNELHSRFAIDRAGAIVSQAAMEIDPYRFTIALLRSAVQQGVRLYRAPVELSHIDRHRVWLRSGESRICAHHVVFATGYEIPAALRSRYCTLKSTYAIASDPIDPSLLWAQRALIWEAGHPYLYMRTTTDNRVVAGGEDEDIVDPNLRDALIPQKSAIICRKVNQMFSRLKIAPSYQWAGTFAEPEDGLPLIGEHEDFPGCLFALGYGGNGIIFSLIAAQIVVGGLTGQGDPDAEIFSFDRIARKGSAGVLQEA